MLGEDARVSKKREILRFVFMPAYDVRYSCYYRRDDVAATVIVRVDGCQKISRDLYDCCSFLDNKRRTRSESEHVLLLNQP